MIKRERSRIPQEDDVVLTVAFRRRAAATYCDDGTDTLIERACIAVIALRIRRAELAVGWASREAVGGKVDRADRGWVPSNGGSRGDPVSRE